MVVAVWGVLIVLGLLQSLCHLCFVLSGRVCCLEVYCERRCDEVHFNGLVSPPPLTPQIQ
jgi:hypothetical protein